METSDTDNILQPSGDAASETIQGKESAQSQTADSTPAESSESEKNILPSPIPLMAPPLDQHPIAVDSNTVAPIQNTVINHQPTDGGHDTLKEANAKKKEDDKLAIYKALAIKLKKELVKSREELQKLREDSHDECNVLKEKVEADATTIATLEAKVKALKRQFESSEADLQALQNDFEDYKVRASKIMQQNNPRPTNSNSTFEEERYKQMKELNDNQKKRISSLETQLSTSLDRNRELEREGKMFQEQLDLVQEKVKLIKVLDNKCETLSRENENLKLALKQFRTRLKEPVTLVNDSTLHGCDNTHKNGGYDATATTKNTVLAGYSGDGNKNSEDNSNPLTANNRLLEQKATDHIGRSSSLDDRLEENTTRLSPSASVKDDSQTNSSSSFDGSTSGYVHIKPTTFEIISRSSVLEDAQNQIDSLTKAYLDSENTNSLLSEQVRALKEEIRRMQRGTERMDLAENLEYLKNIVFKYLSLDSSQIEQKQRLVPVLSTVLKLSPDETAKLNSLTTPDKTSITSSFFKL